MSLFDNGLMQKVVHAYNNKIHKALFNRFTQNQAQHNSMIEHTYIIEKNLEFDRVNHSLMEKYQYLPGDILLCHIPVKQTLKIKRRNNFDTLVYFIMYASVSKFFLHLTCKVSFTGMWHSKMSPGRYWYFSIRELFTL
jgi:hypothetical protein